LTRKEDRKSASKFILEEGFAKDLPGHSLVLTPQGHELLKKLDQIKKTEIEHKGRKTGLRQNRSNKVRPRK
jgi:hypothetical protein